MSSHHKRTHETLTTATTSPDSVLSLYSSAVYCDCKHEHRSRSMHPCCFFKRNVIPFYLQMTAYKYVCIYVCAYVYTYGIHICIQKYTHCRSSAQCLSGQLQFQLQLDNIAVRDRRDNHTISDINNQQSPTSGQHYPLKNISSDSRNNKKKQKQPTTT